ncbi:MAG: large-conductance mechanosensitive channel protein MscL [Patescibacteria group bacterium]
MSKMITEFKEFAMKGNVVDMAIGVVIGGAFGKIVTSFVDDIIMPTVGLLVGGIDFSDLTITLKQATDTAEAVTINYGVFLNTVMSFLIIAFSIFIVIKQLNIFRSKEEKKKDKKPTEDILLLREIRDELRK